MTNPVSAAGNHQPLLFPSASLTETSSPFVAKDAFDQIAPKAVEGGMIYSKIIKHNGENLNVNVFVSTKMHNKLTANQNLQAHLDNEVKKLVATWDIARAKIGEGMVSTVTFKGKKCRILMNDGTEKKGNKVVKEYVKDLKTERNINVNLDENLQAFKYDPKKLVKQKTSPSKIETPPKVDGSDLSNIRPASEAGPTAAAVQDMAQSFKFFMSSEPPLGRSASTPSHADQVIENLTRPQPPEEHDIDILEKELLGIIDEDKNDLSLQQADDLLRDLGYQVDQENKNQ